MSDIQELKNQAYKLSVSDRLELIEAIVQFLQDELRPRPPLPDNFLSKLRGIGKSHNPPPNDAKVEAMLEERLVEKYLK